MALKYIEKSGFTDNRKLLMDNGCFLWWINSKLKRVGTKLRQIPLPEPAKWYLAGGRSVLEHLPVIQTEQMPICSMYLHSGLGYYLFPQEDGKLGVLSRCEKLTGIKADQIPLGDSQIYERIRQLADPETRDSFMLSARACALFGLPVVPVRAPIFDWEEQERIADMVRMIKPDNLERLVRVFGMSMGTGTWKDNGQKLLQENLPVRDEVICHSEDVFRYLKDRGMSGSSALKITEAVRDGKLRQGIPEDMGRELSGCGAEDWFVESIQKIDYLLPEGHSYGVMMNLVHLVWFSIYYPRETEQAMTGK